MYELLFGGLAQPHIQVEKTQNFRTNINRRNEK